MSTTPTTDSTTLDTSSFDPTVNSKDVILSLAMKAIDEGGEASLRVKKIADEAGTAVTSIYHFFGSREGLVEAAQIARFEAGYAEGRRMTLEAARNAESREEFAGIVERILRNLFSEQHHHNRLRRINVVGSAIARPELLEAINASQRRWLAELIEGLAAAQQRGFITRDADVASAATWHLLTVNGFAAIEGDDTGADVDKWVDYYIDTMFRALGLR